MNVELCFSFKHKKSNFCRIKVDSRIVTDSELFILNLLRGLALLRTLSASDYETGIDLPSLLLIV